MTAAGERPRERGFQMSDAQFEDAEGKPQRPSGRALLAALVAVAVVVALVTMVVLDRRTIGSLRAERDQARSELAQSETEEPRASEEESVAPAIEATEQQSEHASQAPAPTTASRGCSAGTYLIGYQGPLTGDYDVLGENMVNGVKLAVQQANRGQALASGARLGSHVTLKVLPLDTQGDPAQAPKVAHSAATNEDVLAVVGPAFSGRSWRLAPSTKQAACPSSPPAQPCRRSSGRGGRTSFGSSVTTRTRHGRSVCSW